MSTRWTAVITSAGLGLLADVQGRVFNFTRAQCGAGYVDVPELENQTAVSDFKKNLGITSITNEENVTKLRLQLSNMSIAASFNLYQIGVFAKLDNDSDDVLFMIIQADTPDYIPSETESPNFVNDYLVNVIVGNADSVSGTVDVSAYVTVGLFQDSFNEVEEVIKNITGKADWKTVPDITLETAKNELDKCIKNLGALSGVDLNTIITAGEYYTGYTCTNIPTSGNGYLKVSISPATGYFMQEIHMFNASPFTLRTFRRQLRNNVWTEWDEITDRVRRSGDFLTGPLGVSLPSTSVRNYRDVLQFERNGAVTGILKITFPFGFDDKLFLGKLRVRNHISPNAIWELDFGAYNASGGGGTYVSSRARASGDVPIDRVRFAFDGSNCCLLLGNTTTQWNTLNLSITEFLYNGGQFLNINSLGFTVDFITSEAGLSNIAEPILQYDNIVQRGSNSNGEFIRFADGTQICTHRINASATANTAGSVIWTFPATFVNDTMRQSANVANNSNTWGFDIALLAMSANTQNISANVRYKFSVTQTYVIDLFVIGRWKN